MVWDLITAADTTAFTLLITPEKTAVTNCTDQASSILPICYILVDQAFFHWIKDTITVFDHLRGKYNTIVQIIQAYEGHLERKAADFCTFANYVIP
jgi:hypothetical protein